MKRGWVEDLPDILQRCYRSPWVDMPAYPDEAYERIPPPESKNSFADWLILSWCVREADHHLALSRPRLNRKLEKLSERGAQLNRILDLTYVPQSIVELLPKIRAGMKSARESNEGRILLQAHKQRIAKGIPSRFTGEQTLSPGLEKLWAARWAFDKQTSALSRQVLWTWIFVPLTTYLCQFLQGRKLDYWAKDTPPLSDVLFEEASALIHYRYPDLWDRDQWPRVKDRCRKYLIP